MRYWIGFVLGLLLGSTPLGASAEDLANPPPETPDSQGSTPEAEQEPARTSPEDAYGIRYARRRLVMPRGMMRGSFDLVLGSLRGDATATMNFGAAISPAKYLEVGFSRYRMGSYPNPDLVRAPGGDGLIPIILNGGDAFLADSGQGRGFGNMLAYLRVEAPTDRASGTYGQAPSSSIADIAFDFGIVLPTASNLGVFFGIPIRAHGGDVFAFDLGFQVNVDNIGEGTDQFTSITLPWNLVFSVTDFLFLKVNSGFDAIDVSSGRALKTFPFGFGMGGTVSSPRIMADIFAAFSWPALGTIDLVGSNPDIWTFTIGTNLYSPVLF